MEDIIPLASEIEASQIENPAADDSFAYKNFVSAVNEEIRIMSGTRAYISLENRDICGRATGGQVPREFVDRITPILKEKGYRVKKMYGGNLVGPQVGPMKYEKFITIPATREFPMNYLCVSCSGSRHGECEQFIVDDMQ